MIARWGIVPVSLAVGVLLTILTTYAHHGSVVYRGMREDGWGVAGSLAIGIFWGPVVALVILEHAVERLVDAFESVGRQRERRRARIRAGLPAAGDR